MKTVYASTNYCGRTELGLFLHPQRAGCRGLQQADHHSHVCVGRSISRRFGGWCTGSPSQTAVQPKEQATDVGRCHWLAHAESSFPFSGRREPLLNSFRLLSSVQQLHTR